MKMVSFTEVAEVWTNAVCAPAKQAMQASEGAQKPHLGVQGRTAAVIRGRAGQEWGCISCAAYQAARCAVYQALDDPQSQAWTVRTFMFHVSLGLDAPATSTGQEDASCGSVGHYQYKGDALRVNMVNFVNCHYHIIIHLFAALTALYSRPVQLSLSRKTRGMHDTYEEVANMLLYLHLSLLGAGKDLLLPKLGHLGCQSPKRKKRRFVRAIQALC